MEIVKLLKDYSKTPFEKKMSEFFEQKFDSTICVEKIKNKEFLISYLKPLNDFVIHTTALPCCDSRRMLY